MSLALSPRRVAKNTVSQLGALALSVASKALAAVWVARTLGPQGLGVFSLAWTLAGTLSFSSLLGIDYRLIRQLSVDPSPRHVERALPLGTLTGLLFAAAVALTPVVVGAGPQLRQALAASAVFIALSGPVLLLRATFHARERMELETATIAVEGAVSLVAVSLVLASGGGVVAALLAFGLGRLANLAVSIVFYRSLFGRLHLRLEPRTWRSTLVASLPAGVTYILTNVAFRFDILVIAALRSRAELGMYGAASTIVLMLPMVAGSLNGALYPVLSRTPSEADPELRSVFQTTWRALASAGFAAAAGLAVLATPIVTLVYGPRFAGAASILAALAWTVPLRFVNNLAGVTLLAVDHHGRRLLTIAIGGLANLVATLALVPAFGSTGAVAAALMTDVVIAVLLVRALRRIGTPLVRSAAEGALAAALVAAAATISPGGVIARAAAGGAAFAVLVAAASVRLPRLGPATLGTRK